MATNVIKRTFLIRNDQPISDYVTSAANLAVDGVVWAQDSNQRFNSSNTFLDQWYSMYTYSTSVNDALFLTWLTSYLVTHSSFQYRMYSETVALG